MALSVPTIHHNGTPRDRLLEETLDARRALRAALDAIATAAPNARDYYPQGDHAFAKANGEHLARLQKLQEVCRELDELAEAIAG